MGKTVSRAPSIVRKPLFVRKSRMRRGKWQWKVDVSAHIYFCAFTRTHAHSHRGKTVLIGVLKPFKIGCWSNRAHSCSRSCWWCIVNCFTCSKYQETLRFENRHINCVFHCSVAHRTAVEMQASPSQAAKIECFRTLLPYLFLSFTRSIRNPSFHFGWNRESEIRIMAACKPYSNDG